MAITIEDQPTATLIRPAFAPIDFLLSSGNTAEAGFKIVCKVYLSPAGANTLISTQQVYTIPAKTQAVFKVQDVIKSYVTSVYSVIDGDTVDLIETTLPNFAVTFQEFYDGALKGSVVTSNTFSAWYSSPTYVEFAANDWHEWQVSTGDVRKEFLNNYGNQVYKFSGFNANDNWLKVSPTQKFQISWLLKATSTIDIELETFTSAFVSVVSTKMTEASKAIGEYALDVGAAQLAAHTWNATVDMTNVKYYALTIFETFDQDQEVKTILFEVDSCTTNYTPYELHWLNRKGGYDSMVFDGKSTETTDINKSFAKYANSDISGTSLDYKTSNQRTRAFHTGIKTQYKINSRLLKDFEMVGMQDLYTSPEVYWLSPDGFINVNTEMKTFERMKSEDGQVYSVELTMTVDNSDERQW